MTFTINKRAMVAFGAVLAVAEATGEATPPTKPAKRSRTQEPAAA